MTQSEVKLKWFDAFDIGVEGQGWSDTVSPYDRLPAKAQGVVPEWIWNLSRSATGMCVNFSSDTRQVYLRWVLCDDMLGEGNFPVAGYSGFDLYGDDCGTWRWVASTHRIEKKEQEYCIVNYIDGKVRDYRLYLPLRNPVLKLEIGVPEENIFTAIPPRCAKPVVCYGTSIVHGAYASHAGLVYPSIIGRRCNLPVINLGFSGSARMEIELADLLGEIDAGIYILDPLPNMDLTLVNERAEKFIKRLHYLRPDSHIIMVEDFPRTNSWIIPGSGEDIAVKCRRYHEIYEQLVKEGISGLSYVFGNELLGTDNEASIDGIHPGDLGYMRMADIIGSVVNSVLLQKG
jgi:hypothetical protein